MIAVQADKNEIQIRIPTAGMSVEAVNAFVDWLRVEAVARRSRLTEEKAWQLGEEIKSDWWARNQGRFSPDKGE